MTGHWELAVPWEDPPPFGFVYEIHDPNGMIYIGKKQIWSRRKMRPLKGKKRSRFVNKQTDWKEYTGSCAALNERLAEKGKDGFRFVIVDWADCKGELAYKEIKRQLDSNALLDPKYYNGIVNCRIPRPSTPWKRTPC